MATFDESKPFGYVRGSSGARYEQNGHLFDGQKREVDIDGRPVKAPTKKPEPAKAPAGDAKKPAQSRKPKQSAAPEGVKSMAELAKEGSDE